MSDRPLSIHGDDVLRDQGDVLRDAALDRRMSYLKALEEIDAEIAEIQMEMGQKIAAARVRRGPIVEALSHLDALLRIEGWIRPEDDILQIPHSSSRSGKEPIDAAHDILDSEGKPIHYRELTKRLEDQGTYLSGKDPAATLLSRMSRDRRFRRGTERGTYGLASWRMRRGSGRGSRARRSSSRRGR